MSAENELLDAARKAALDASDQWYEHYRDSDGQTTDSPSDWAAAAVLRVVADRIRELKKNPGWSWPGIVRQIAAECDPLTGPEVSK